jgi:large subunit ribosomal protein L25
MEEIVIEASKRDIVGKQVKQLRRDGKLPAVLYGREMDPVPITLDLRETSRLLVGVTPSSLIKVMLEDEEMPALVRETQRDILKGSLLHVDFQVVSLTETVRANVAIQLEGESPAVIENNAILVTGLEEIEVECLPQDLPGRITVDISGLEDIGDAVYVHDLDLSSKIHLWSDPEELVVLVTWIAPEELLLEEEEEEEALLEELEEPEVIERGKRVAEEDELPEVVEEE